MPPTAQHEALHRIFQRDEALFARAVARVFNVLVPAPVNVTVLSTDLTETEPIERRADSVLQAEFMVEEAAGKYCSHPVPGTPAGQASKPVLSSDNRSKGQA